ncbi:MAG TPA: hypothetical protein VFX28_11070, partial [Methylomirabilota bacterium]|nr:hypothetical protein [Methylomirabilota bacterium]
MSMAAEGAPPRRHASSTRAFHLRRILRGRAAGYAFGLGITAAFVAGAWLGSPLLMAAGPAAVVALVGAAAFVV